MVSFRVALLLIGLGLIAAVYLWDRLVSRRRFNSGARMRGQAVPRSGLQVSDTDHLDQVDDFAEFRDPMETERKGSDNGGDSEGRSPKSQIALGFGADKQASVGNKMIVSLFIEAAPGRSITGSELVEAMRDAGLRFGEKGIFHHYGVSGMEASAPLFSVANMFEPGSFELAALATMETKGLVVFVHLSGEEDASVAFELMFDTAERLTERFGGRLLDDQYELLSQQTITKLREELFTGT